MGYLGNSGRLWPQGRLEESVSDEILVWLQVHTGLRAGLVGGVLGFLN